MKDRFLSSAGRGRNFKFATGVCVTSLDHVRSALATFNRSASPASECPPPPPARSKISVGSGETGNTNARLISPGTEEILQTSRAQTLDQVYRKAHPTEVTGKFRGHHSSLRSPTRKKPPMMSVIAEPTTKIKVADVVENCRYSGWVRKQGGSYKSCESLLLSRYLLGYVCLVECVRSYPHSSKAHVVSLSVSNWSFSGLT